MSAITLPETHTRHVQHARPAPVEFAAAVLNELLMAIIRLLAVVQRVIVGPEFVMPTEREPFGADPQYGDDLHAMVMARARDRQAVVFHTALGDTYPGLAIDDSVPLLATYDAAALALAGGER